MDGYGHDGTCGGEYYTIGSGTILEPFPIPLEGELIDVTIYPATIVAVIGNESIDDVNVWETGKEITVIFWSGELIGTIDTVLSTI